jgi:hypothetical protein
VAWIEIEEHIDLGAVGDRVRRVRMAKIREGAVEGEKFSPTTGKL